LSNFVLTLLIIFVITIIFGEDIRRNFQIMRKRKEVLEELKNKYTKLPISKKLDEGNPHMFDRVFTIIRKELTYDPCFKKILANKYVTIWIYYVDDTIKRPNYDDMLNPHIFEPPILEVVIGNVHYGFSAKDGRLLWKK
jgi:hypothetical protein